MKTELKAATNNEASIFSFKLSFSIRWLHAQFSFIFLSCPLSHCRQIYYSERASNWKNSLLGLLINSILFVALESLFRICESNTSFPLFLDEKRYFQATYQSGDLMIPFQAEHHRTATAGEEKSLLLPNLVIFYIPSITRRPKLVPLYE